MPTSDTPVLFIHGLWIHFSAWQPWVELFTERGYNAVAPGWPGDGSTVAATRADPEALNNVGIDAIREHYADIIGRLDVKPVVVGHSFGGLIAQALLADQLAAAAVAIDPAPIKGVKTLPFSQLKSGFPVLGNPANKKRTVSLTAKQFRYSFGNAVSEEESNELHDRWMIPGPGRPLFEDATANFSRNSPAAVNTRTAVRGPLLMASGTDDNTVPKAVTVEAFKLYSTNTASVTDYHVFDGRGHSLTIDNGWRDVANVVLDWLVGKGFAAEPQSSVDSTA